MKSNSFFEKLSIFLILLFSFSFAVFSEYMPIIIVLLVGSFILKAILCRNITIQYTMPILLMGGLYLLYLVGLFWSSNKEAGSYTLETMFSLLLFPILFTFNRDFFKNNILKILLWFIIGCTVSSIVCLAVAFWESTSFVSGSIVFNSIDKSYASWEYGGSHFKYTNLSFVLHPTYYSCYLLFSAICSILILRKKILINRSLIAFLLLSIPLFLLMIYLLSSKAGIICTIICVIFFTAVLISEHKPLHIKISIAFACLILVFMAIQNPRFASIADAIQHPERVSDSLVNGSVVSRVHIWKAGIEIIADNFFTGVGTGNSKDELVRKYELYGFTDPFRLKANAHNQFFETFIDLGVGGFLLLLLLFIYPVRQSLRRKNSIFLLFLFVLAFNFLFETMLNKMSGAIFFGFFYCLLSIVDEDDYYPTSYKNKKTKDLIVL